MISRCGACGRLNRVRAEYLRGNPRCGGCQTALSTREGSLLVTDDELEALIRTSTMPLLVDFFAEWCAPCRTLAPMLDQLGTKFAGRLMVVKVDTERHARQANRLGIQGLPAVFLFRDGAVLESVSGLLQPHEWERLVARHI